MSARLSTKSRLARRRRRSIATVFQLVLPALLLGLMPPAPAGAGVATWTTAGPRERIAAVVAHPADEQRVLAAGESGVWRTADGGATWNRLATTALRRAPAFDPLAPDTIYGVSGDGKSVLKSTTGGADWAPVYSGAGSTQVHAVVADPNVRGAVYAGITDADGLAQLLRSTDGGASWGRVLPPDLRGAGGIGQTAVTTLAAVPGVPGFLVAGVQLYHGGRVLRSTDGGLTWTAVYGGRLTPLASPTALAAGGASAATATVYAHFSIMGVSSLIRSDDGGATWADVSQGLPLQGSGHARNVSGLLVHPAQPRWVYLALWTTASASSRDVAAAGVFVSDDRGETWTEAGRLEPAVSGPHGLTLAVPSRTLYAATANGVWQLTIAWPVLPLFRDYYDAHDGYRLLGTGISFGTAAGGRTAQYFEKGRLEDHTSGAADPNWRMMYGLLVDELHAAGAPLPVGGDASSLDYAGVRTLADPSQRVAPPSGYRGSGTMTVADDGTTFVPFSADLAGAPGHLLPGPFWQYVNRTDLFPGGWLHDVGLPITPAQHVRVTKYLPAGPVDRTIVVQAFQRTILTLDPENPPDWQVERANVGTDYRKFFPDRAGP